jgi:hypothetical protein
MAGSRVIKQQSVVGHSALEHDKLADVVKLDVAAALALSLPEVVEGERFGHRTWNVIDKGFAWERPFSKADIKRFGDEPPPDGPIVAVYLGDLGEKEAVLQAGTTGVFTIAHFNNYPAVLAHLRTITKTALRDLLIDGWLAQAPPALAEAHPLTELRRATRGATQA